MKKSTRGFCLSISASDETQKYPRHFSETCFSPLTVKWRVLSSTIWNCTKLRQESGKKFWKSMKLIVNRRSTRSISTDTHSSQVISMAQVIRAVLIRSFVVSAIKRSFELKLLNPINKSEKKKTKTEECKCVFMCLVRSGGVRGGGGEGWDRLK